MPKSQVLIYAPEVSKASTKMLEKAFAKCVDKFIAAEKRHKWKDAWRTDLTEVQMQKMLAEHLLKGDPCDVAIIAMFAVHFGWSTSPLSVRQPLRSVVASKSRPE